jgi:hypothetical protein
MRHPAKSVKEVLVKMKIYSYVVDHDDGYAPNPYFGMCTLCRCKFSKKAEETQGQRGRKNIVELAEKGDWVIGTGGESGRSAGHGKLIYAMRVDEKLSREEYYKDSRFAEKKPVKNGVYEKTQGDNECPITDFQKHEQFALISEHFWYFGKKAIDILKFKLEKNHRGFHCVDLAEFDPFLEWLEAKYKQPGIHGEPCGKVADERKGSERCKSSC